MSLLSTLLYPPRCVSCRVRLPWREALQDGAQTFCSKCQVLWDAAGEVRCGVCGLPVCSCECLTEELQKARIAMHRKLFYYDPNRENSPQSRILFAMKHGANARAEAFLAQELFRRHGELFSNIANPVLCYVPRRKEAKRQNGTDQAERITAALSRVSKIPSVRALQRARGKRAPQKTLSIDGRIAAAKKSFCLTRKAREVSGRTIILIDDTVTSGASMAACARLLRRSGANKVIALSVASDTYNARLCFPKAQKK